MPAFNRWRDAWAKYETSLKQYPPIKMGTPGPYVPPLR
jgi:hypothetical protein